MAEIIAAYDRLDDVLKLLREYTTKVVEDDPSIADVLSTQNYDQELANLADKYALPRGRLYIALSGGEPVGCAALRDFDGDSCEVKRLYVRPEMRGRHIGYALMNTCISAAKEIGYKRILIDTMPGMVEGRRMYSSLGFIEIPPYYDSGSETMMYFELLL